MTFAIEISRFSTSNYTQYGNMVKCAAYNCRSGYKPTNSEKEILKSGGSIPFHRSVFSFPNKMNHKEVRDKWIRPLKLKENNWNPDNFRVCKFHFRKEDFLIKILLGGKLEENKRC